MTTNVANQMHADGALHIIGVYRTGTAFWEEVYEKVRNPDVHGIFAQTSDEQAFTFVSVYGTEGADAIIYQLVGTEDPCLTDTSEVGKDYSGQLKDRGMKEKEKIAYRCDTADQNVFNWMGISGFAKFSTVVVLTNDVHLISLCVKKLILKYENDHIVQHLEDDEGYQRNHFVFMGVNINLCDTFTFKKNKEDVNDKDTPIKYFKVLKPDLDEHNKVMYSAKGNMKGTPMGEKAVVEMYGRDLITVYNIWDNKNVSRHDSALYCNKDAYRVYDKQPVLFIVDGDQDYANSLLRLAVSPGESETWPDIEYKGLDEPRSK